MDILDRLDAAAQAVASVARGVKPEQLSQPSPCEGWDVHALMNHMIGSCERFVLRAEGKPVPGQEIEPTQTASCEEATKRLAEGAVAAAKTWRAPGALERTVTGPMGEMKGIFMASITLTELLMHGWDLAKATGQQLPLDDAVAEETFAEMNGKLPPEARGRAFGEERQAPAGASALDKMAAYFGRG